MCGIAGVYAYAGRADSIGPAIDRMCERMAVRGPDGAGVWFSDDRTVALGHRRLAIIDLSPAGAQPMTSANGRVVISFNGEIYNYRALRAELERSGRRFHTQSDTEVLLALYAERGADMVRALRGMFAFALWDEDKRAMLVARDPFGIKPLYYSMGAGVARVASEVKALLAGGGIDTEPEPAGHVGFFLWGSVPEPYTLYRGIRSLPAGSTMWIERDGAHEPCKYADVVDAWQEVSAARSADSDQSELRDALLDTMRNHLVADVDVGIFLSAGLDSTTQTALVKELGVRPRTVTLGFAEYRGTAQDEVPLAESVARHYGADHQTIWITRQDFRAQLDVLLDRMDQPTIDGVNVFFVARAAAAAGLKVALSGLGGDELFGGYPSFHQVPRIVSMTEQVPVGAALGVAARRFFAPAFSMIGKPKYAGTLEYGREYGAAYLLRRCLYAPWELERVLDPDILRDGWAALSAPESIDALVSRLPDSHAKVSVLESALYMRNQLLRDADWGSMSHSVEVRVPFVDMTLWNRVAPLRRHGILTKRNLAAAAHPALPDAVRNRAKSGFVVPTRQWIALENLPGKQEPGLRSWARHVYARHVPRTVASRASA